jgi:hypothetical protein
MDMVQQAERTGFLQRLVCGPDAPLYAENMKDRWIRTTLERRQQERLSRSPLYLPEQQDSDKLEEHIVHMVNTDQPRLLWQ